MSHAVRSLVSTLTILSMLSPSLAFAAERFWVGNYTNVWNDAKNWSATLGGGGGATVPGASDTAMIVKNNSGNTIQINAATTVGGIVLSPVFTGSLRTGTSTLILGGTGMKIGSGYLVIGTGATLASSGTWLQTGGVVYNVRANHRLRLSGGLIIMRRARFRYSGTIVFNGNADQTLAFSGSSTPAAPATIAVGRYSFSGMILDKTGGTTVDDVVVSGATLKMRNLVINNGNFSLDGATSANTEGRRPAVVAALSGGITIANDADAMFSTNANVTLSGSISTGAAGLFAMSGATTLTLNGIRQDLDISGANSRGVHTLVIESTSGAYLTATALVTSALTINSTRILTFAANTLNLTGGVITNNGTIRENTGKLVHTGSAVKMGDSAYNELAEIQAGSTLYLSVTDTDENISGTAADTITVVVSISGGDSETVTLTETTNTSGIFRNSIVTETAAAVTENAKLSATVDKIVTMTYTDAQDGLVKTDTIIFTPIGSSATASTNSGGGSSRSRSAGGGGGGGGTVSTPAQTPKPTTPPPRVAPPAVQKKKMTVGERKAARMQRLQDMLGRKNARKASRQGR